MNIIMCLIVIMTVQVGETSLDNSHPAAWDTTIDALAAPCGVTFLPDGRMLLTEQHSHTVAVVQPNDNASETWIQRGILHQPHGIDSNHVGVIAVADKGNHLVRFFDSQGVLVHTIDGEKLTGRSFRSPMDVALSNSRLVVADTGNDRVVVFNKNGTYEWSSDEINGLNLSSPEGVDIDDSGNVFIADTGNHRVLIFDRTGKPVSEWGDWGRFPGLFAEPSGIEVHDDKLYVADRLNHRVQIFDFNGKLISWWGMHAVVPRQGKGQIHYPSDIALNAEGDRSLVTEPFERRGQVFKLGPPSRPDRSNTKAPGGLQSHFGPHLESSSRGLISWEPEVRSLPVFITDRQVPIHVTTFGMPGTGPGKIGTVSDLSWNHADNVLTILDSEHNTMQHWRIELPAPGEPRFIPEAAVLLSTSPLPKVQSGEWLHPIAGDYGDDGVLHIVDGHEDEIYSYSDGQLIPWEIDFDPVAIDVGTEVVAVADGRTGQIHLFDLNREPIRSIGPAPNLSNPQPGGILLLDDGTLMMSDSAADRLDHFSIDGTHLRTLSSSGGDHGEVWMPGEIAEDANGRIIVLDQGNHRLQGFEPDKGWVLTFGLGKSMTPERLERSKRK